MYIRTANGHIGSREGNVPGSYKVMCNVCGNYYTGLADGTLDSDKVKNHFTNYHRGSKDFLGVATLFSYETYEFERYNGCDDKVWVGGTETSCGETISAGTKVTQPQSVLGVYTYNPSTIEDNITIPLDTSISIKVQKIWEDYNDNYGTRPSSIQFRLQRKISSASTWSDVGTYTLTESKGWETTINKLDDKDSSGNLYNYRVVETEPTGYTATYSPASVNADSADKTLTITNTLNNREVEIKVTKQWNDNHNYNKTRPDTIDLVVYRRIIGGEWEPALTEGTDYEFIIPRDANGNIQWDKTNTWAWETKIKIKNIKDSNGNFYEFKIHEKGQGNKVTNQNIWYITYGSGTYEVTYKSTDKNNKIHDYGLVCQSEVTIINKLHEIDITVEKEWDDYDESNGLRPKFIKFDLMKCIGGEYKDNTFIRYSDWETCGTYEINAEDDWKTVIENLPINADGGRYYYYKVKEVYVEGTSINNYIITYDKEYGIIKQASIKITNKIKNTKIKIVKEWEDLNNAYGTRPEEIKIGLWQTTNIEDERSWKAYNGYILKAEENWTLIIDGLPITDPSGEEYFYQVVEQANQIPSYYEVEYTPTNAAVNATDSERTITITNTLEKTDITVIKKWDDNHNYYGSRPENIELVVHRRTHNPKGDWEKLTEGTDYQIERDANGKIIWTKNEETDEWVVNITNLDVQDDSGNFYDFRVREADTNKIENVNVWTMKNGSATYEVTYLSTTADEKYSSDYGWVRNGTITITNTLKSIDLTVEKTWTDYDAENEFRPKSVEFELQCQDGTEGEWTVLGTHTLNDENAWKKEFKELPVKADSGNYYYYKVNEIKLEGAKIENYKVTYNGNEDGSVRSAYIVINNEIQETKIKIMKIWDDYDNAHGIRPDSIVVNIVAYTEETKNDENKWLWVSVILRAEDEWTVVVDDLPVKDTNGNIYYFEVVEQVKQIPQNYMVEYEPEYVENKVKSARVKANDSNRTVTITNILKLIDIDITKIWDDHDNAYGKRPDEINLEVYRSTTENPESWGTPLVLGTDYTIDTWTKNGDTWTTTIRDLFELDKETKQPYYYKVVEKPVEHYDVAYENNVIKAEQPGADGQNKQITIINTLNYFDLTVNKVWLDKDNEYETRLQEITFDLYRTTTKENQDSWVPVNSAETPYVLNTENNWTIEINGLEERDSEGNKYYYKAVERGIPNNNYKVEYTTSNGENIILEAGKAEDDGTGENITITNILDEGVDIEIEKTWDDNHNYYGARPKAIKIQVSRSTNLDAENWEVLEEGTDYTITWEDKEQTPWNAIISDLKLHDENNNFYYFKVEEIGFMDENGNEIEFKHYNVIYESGKGADGNPVYTNSIIYGKENKIINKLVDTEIKVSKYWADHNDKFNVRPDSITFKLYRCEGILSSNGNFEEENHKIEDWEEYRKEDYVITGDNWITTIDNLPVKSESGNYYYYKVVENDIPNYDTIYVAQGNILQEGIVKRGFIQIRNILEFVDISITKQWEDRNNNFEGEINGIRPDDITIKVYRSTEENPSNWGQPLILGTDYEIAEWEKDGNTWETEIFSLLRDTQGNLYYYKIEEISEGYYTVTYTSGGYTDGRVDYPKNTSGELDIEPNNDENGLPESKVIRPEITITNELEYVDISFTKQWNDYRNEYNIRPGEIELTVQRSTNPDAENWETVAPSKYNITWTSNGNTDDIWTANIKGLLGVNENGESYYYRVLEKTTGEILAYYDPECNPEQYNKDNQDHNLDLRLTNKLKKINISGYVWLDGQTGIKPPEVPNGKMDDTESKMKDIVVHLYYKRPKTQGGEIVEVTTTKTNENGYYEFKEVEIGYYYVEFDYDGIHYEDTIEVTGEDVDRTKLSKAFEAEEDRNKFNKRFQTITHGQSKYGTALNYSYADGKSTLITQNNDGTVKSEFLMKAATPKPTAQESLLLQNTENLNLGLVERGTDIALSTDVYDAKVTINGQETKYEYNTDTDTITIGNTQTSENASYNLNLYASDYNYRIRNYVSDSYFKEKNYINDTDPNIKTGDELYVYVTYKVNLQNQSSGNVYINEVKYVYDEKYTYSSISDENYKVADNGNEITIDLKALKLTDGQTKTIYLTFEVKETTDNKVILGDFSNSAEITSYSTDEGLIDIDSQPGNFMNYAQIEDDNDTAGGLKITVVENLERKLTGKVFDGSNNVNDVIVQLIELKEVAGTVYEYIWQETVSGTGKVYKTSMNVNPDGSVNLEEYNYTPENGQQYGFKGFIPGDYIVRFIYGDGTTYDMTGNVIKYNGQDYKSVVDSNYNSEWYNSSLYTEGASVARDNEARRLETMAYSVNIDVEKGLLLKLLDNLTVDNLNETEKETLVSIYNKSYDPDITKLTLTNDNISKLLKEQVLPNTWMCAETSKIKVAVDTEDIKNTAITTDVNGITRNCISEISNINLGLEKRPETKIELKKYITGFKLTAANGQTLVNATIDVNEYFDNPIDISNEVKGIKDNLTVIENVWQYEVTPTEINTVVDGANLEFEYTLVVRNTGETDYLSSTLANEYNTKNSTQYAEYLNITKDTIKTSMREGKYKDKIGDYVGSSYYAGGTGTDMVLTEVTNIRDYVNNDLTFVFSYEGKVEEDNVAPKTHRILRDDFSMQETTLTTILTTTEGTGKMDNNANPVMYTVTLGKNPISSTGKLDFDTYIAEVMSYTNAAGRRATTSTPGNAEIIDIERRDGRIHEIDEADTGRIQIGVKTGEDKETNYIIITCIISGIALVATGAFVVKKYVIK